MAMLRPGIYRGPDQQHALLRNRLHLKAKHSLRDLAEDFVLFSHATLFTVGHLTADPAAEFANTHDAYIEAILYDHVIFEGINGTDERGEVYRRMLWACERAHWPAFSEFMRMLTPFSREQKTCFAVQLQECRIADLPLLASGTYSGDCVPFVDVSVFCVDGNRDNVVFVPDASNTGLLMIRRPVSDAARQTAKLLLKDNVEGLLNG